MPNLNRVMLMGNLTRDPELRYTPSNTPVAQVGLAINRRWRNQQTNEWQEETTFVDCEAWGKQAETINQYLRKGRPVYIEGRLKLDQWQDKEGNNRSKIKVVIESFQFIDSQRSGGQGGSAGAGGEHGETGDGGPAPAAVPPRSAPQRPANRPAGNTAPMDANQPPSMGEDDIPF